MKYLLKIDSQHDNGKKYKFIASQGIPYAYECQCGCYVFSKSGEEWVCNSCYKRHLVETKDYVCPVCKKSYPDDEKCNEKECINQCVSCREVIKSDDKKLTDTDNLGPYCLKCHDQLPKELKKAEGVK